MVSNLFWIGADMRARILNAHFYALSTVLLWSSAYVFTKVGLKYFSGPVLGFLRCFAASIALGLVLILTRTSPPKVRDLPWLLLSGASGFSVYLLVFNYASAFLNPTTSCVIISSAPIMTALLARGLFKEQLSFYGWTAIITAFGGILVMTLWDGELTYSKGVFWMTLAAVLISAYNIIQRRLVFFYTPLSITSHSFIAATASLLWIMPRAGQELAAAPPAYWALAVFLGLFPSALAYFLWTKAMSMAPRTGTVTNYMYLTPLLALFLEYLVLGETPGVGTYIGGVIILASLFLFSRKGRRSAA